MSLLALPKLALDARPVQVWDACGSNVMYQACLLVHYTHRSMDLP